jgi:hypothetical protein
MKKYSHSRQLSDRSSLPEVVGVFGVNGKVNGRRVVDRPVALGGAGPDRRPLPIFPTAHLYFPRGHVHDMSIINNSSTTYVYPEEKKI